MQTLLSPVHRATTSSCVPPAPPRPALVPSWPHLIGVWASAGNLGPSSAHSIVAWAGPQHLGASPWKGGARGTMWCREKGPGRGLSCNSRAGFCDEGSLRGLRPRPRPVSAEAPPQGRVPSLYAPLTSFVSEPQGHPEPALLGQALRDLGRGPATPCHFPGVKLRAELHYEVDQRFRKRAALYVYSEVTVTSRHVHTGAWGVPEGGLCAIRGI